MPECARSLPTGPRANSCLAAWPLALAAWAVLSALALCGCRTYVVAVPNAQPGTEIHVTVYSDKTVDTPIQASGGRLK